MSEAKSIERNQNMLNYFSGVIKKNRKEKNIAIKQIIEKTGVNYATYMKIENGEIFGRVDLLYNVFKMLDLNLAQIICDYEEVEKQLD